MTMLGKRRFNSKLIADENYYTSKGKRLVSLPRDGLEKAKCETCGEVADNELELLKHRESKHLQRACAYCPAQFASIEELIGHYKADHRDGDPRKNKKELVMTTSYCQYCAQMHDSRTLYKFDWERRQIVKCSCCALCDRDKRPSPKSYGISGSRGRNPSGGVRVVNLSSIGGGDMDRGTAEMDDNNGHHEGHVDDSNNHVDDNNTDNNTALDDEGDPSTEASSSTEPVNIDLYHQQQPQQTPTHKYQATTSSSGGINWNRQEPGVKYKCFMCSVSFDHPLVARSHFTRCHGFPKDIELVAQSEEPVMAGSEVVIEAGGPDLRVQGGEQEGDIGVDGSNNGEGGVIVDDTGGYHQVSVVEDGEMRTRTATIMNADGQQEIVRITTSAEEASRDIRTTTHQANAPSLIQHSGRNMRSIVGIGPRNIQEQQVEVHVGNSVLGNFEQQDVRSELPPPVSALGTPEETQVGSHNLHHPSLVGQTATQYVTVDSATGTTTTELIGPNGQLIQTTTTAASTSGDGNGNATPSHLIPGTNPTPTTRFYSSDYRNSLYVAGNSRSRRAASSQQLEQPQQQSQHSPSPVSHQESESATLQQFPTHRQHLPNHLSQQSHQHHQQHQIIHQHHQQPNNQLYEVRENIEFVEAGGSRDDSHRYDFEEDHYATMELIPQEYAEEVTVVAANETF